MFSNQRAFAWSNLVFWVIVAKMPVFEVQDSFWTHCNVSRGGAVAGVRNSRSSARIPCGGVPRMASWYCCAKARLLIATTLCLAALGHLACCQIGSRACAPPGQILAQRPLPTVTASLTLPAKLNGSPYQNLQSFANLQVDSSSRRRMCSVVSSASTHSMTLKGCSRAQLAVSQTHKVDQQTLVRRHSGSASTENTSVTTKKKLCAKTTWSKITSRSIGNLMVVHTVVCSERIS